MVTSLFTLVPQDISHTHRTCRERYINTVTVRNIKIPHSPFTKGHVFDASTEKICIASANLLDPTLATVYCWGTSASTLQFVVNRESYIVSVLQL